MAYNPLYPGYSPEKPGESSSNPLTPGYYPGKKMPRKFEPSSGSRIGVPVDVQFGAVQAVDDLMKDAGGVLTTVPNWIRDRMADDFAGAFKVTSMAPQGASDITYDEYDTDAVFGAGYIQLNVDPREWIKNDEKRKDPKKMLKKTAEKWVKSVLNASDFENAARQAFWKELTTREDIVVDKGAVGKGRDLASRYVEDENWRRKSKGLPENPNPFLDPKEKIRNPLFRIDEKAVVGENAKLVKDLIDKENSERVRQGLPQIDIKDLKKVEFLDPGSQQATELKTLVEQENNSRVAKGVPKIPDPLAERVKVMVNPLYLKGDEYKGVGESYATAFRSLQSPLTRDKSFDSAMKDSLGAVGREFGSKAGELTAKLTPQQLDAIDSFQKRVKIAENFGVGKTRDDVVKKLKNLTMNGAIDRDGFDSLVDGMKDMRGKVSKLQKSISDNRGLLEQHYGKAWVASIEGRLGLLEKATKSTHFDTFISAKSAAGLSGSARQLIRDLDMSPGLKGILSGRDFQGGDVFAPSFERQMRMGLFSELCGGDSEIYRIVSDGSLGLEAGKLIPVGNSLVFQRNVRALDEVTSKISGGPSSFLETYLWSNRASKISGAGFSMTTPKVLVQTGLRKVQNLGLVLDEESLKTKTFYKLASKDYTRAPNAVFGNRFKADVIYKGSTFKAKLWGGEHFNAVEHLKFGGKLLGKVDVADSEKMIRKMLVEGRTIGNWRGDKFIINKDFRAMLSGLKGEELERVTRDLGKLQDRIKEFREYSMENIAKKMGVDLSKMDLRQKEEFWNSVRASLTDKKLQNNFITRRYLGLMEKTSQAMNYMQAKLFEIAFIKNAFQKYFFIKDFVKEQIKILSERIAQKIMSKIVLKMSTSVAFKALINAILQIIGTTLPGLGNALAVVIAWIIEKLIDLAIKIIKKIVLFFKRLAKGEITAIVEEYEKKLDKNVKRFLGILIVILVIMTFFGFIIQLIVPNIINVGGIITNDPFDDLVPFSLSTFSPVDMSRRYGYKTQSFDWNIELDPTDGPSEPASSGGSGGGGISETECGTCDLEAPKHMPTQSSGGSAARNRIISEGYRIAQDLERGFWCFFNHSSIYPQHWDDGEFATNPCLSDYDRNNPDFINTLFWCTYMVIYTQRAAHPGFDMVPGSCTLTEYIKAGGEGNYKLKNRADTLISEIKPGDIIFFADSAGSDIVASPCSVVHVGIVYSVSSDGITTLESNSYDVSRFLPVENCGKSSCPVSAGDDLNVGGFGLNIGI